ncbi:methyltransferase domain-containing protein [candidate division WOR-3 bacterium]|nr:methyltransferase domain-containing protein [candidate division WOR-3 bacterium]
MPIENKTFNRWAKTYDADIRKAEAHGNWMYKNYTALLKKVVEIIEKKCPNKGIKLIDIGAGTGNLTQLFQLNGYQITGIEPSDKMISQFKAKLPSVKIRKGNFCDIPLPDNSIDAIVSTYAWHHLTPREKEQSIPEMSRVLKENSSIVIADLMFSDKTTRVKILHDLMTDNQVSIIEAIESEYYADINHVSKCYRRLAYDVNSTQMTDFVWIIYAYRSI